MSVADQEPAGDLENETPAESPADSPQGKETSSSSHQPTDANMNDAQEKAKPNGENTEKTRPKDAQEDAEPNDEGAGKTQPNGRPDGAKRVTTEFNELKEKITDKKRRIRDKTKPPGGYDKTPLPDVPPGYTVKITFHKATNLPAADINTHSADPYILATLMAAPTQTQRHRDDPILAHRTRTIAKTTNAEWEEEWIVANVPTSGFTLKCRLFDEDATDHDDKLGDVTVRISHVDERWKGLGPEGKVFDVRKRTGSKRAYFVRAITSGLSPNATMTPHLHLSIDVLGRSDPPGGHMYTVGPTRWIRHFSPMIGRLARTRVNKDESDDCRESASPKADDKGTQKYDFQANEIQLAGPVPPKLYHRWVEFRPVIGMMFMSHGLRGWILNKALHKQHNRVYNFNSSTQYGTFKACSKEASLELLKMAHFDEGGRIFTYVLTLDGVLRFTETGKEFGIDMLSKHTMHSDVARYIACSGEFFIRRLKARLDPEERDEADPPQPTHPNEDIPGGPPDEPPPHDPALYQLIIDNDSGTYRPDKSVLPDLKAFLERNFPGLGVVVMHCQDKELDHLKQAQTKAKKREGEGVNMVLNRSPSASSLGSDDESRLGDLEGGGVGNERVKSKKERGLELLEDPHRLKGMLGEMSGGDAGEKAQEKTPHEKVPEKTADHEKATPTVEAAVQRQ